MGQAALGNLPPELLGHILTYTDLTDLQSLSSTNRAFRTTLEPRIFRAIRLDSNPEEAWPVLSALATREHIRSSVTTLSFVGIIDHLVRQAGFDATINVVPKLARQALSGTLFPNVRTVYIGFDFGKFRTIFTDDEQNLDTAEEWDDESYYAPEYIESTYTFEVAEGDRDNTRRKENKFPWRSMMNQVWESLAANRNITNLVAVNLLPKPTSTFYTPEWAAFVGRLRELDVSLWYGNHRGGWDANLLEGYTYFYAVQTEELFYQHCRNLSRLSIDASPSNAIGGGDGARFDEKLLLSTAHFPMLERLEPTNIYMNYEIAGFIADKTTERSKVEDEVKPLRSVALWNCHVNTDSGMTSWKQFFERLLGDGNRGDENLGSLRELDISYLYGDDVTIPCAPNVEGAPFYEPESHEHKELLEEMQTSGRKAFSYCNNGFKYGNTGLHLRVLFNAFKIGEDERAYLEVMKRVERNNVVTS